MKRLTASIGSDPVMIHVIESPADYSEYKAFVLGNSQLGLDTESTGYEGIYTDDWWLRLFQIGNAHHSYVFPVENGTNRELLDWTLSQEHIEWLAHNAPHDVLAIDRHLGWSTGLLERFTDTFTKAHLLDPRGVKEGGTGHKLKDLCRAHLDSNASDGQDELKAEFKKLRVPVEQAAPDTDRPEQLGFDLDIGVPPKTRVAKLSEGWRWIPIDNEVYLVYAGLDTILTCRLNEVLDRKLEKRYELVGKAEIQG